MSTKVLVKEDIITSVFSGDVIVQGGIDVPPNLNGLEPNEMRFNGTSVIDVRSNTVWYVDDRGVKHIANKQGRTQISCALTDKLVKYNGVWSLLDAAQEAKKALYAYATLQRDVRIQKGIAYSGVSIIPDARTTSFLTGARIKAEANNAYQIDQYRVGNNTYISLTASQIIDISDQLEALVQSSFDINANVDAQINSGAITLTSQIDAAFAA